MLNLKHLYYFHIFAQELSTTKAAQRLSISPPALSNQLKVLEEFLGFKLTHRVQNKVVITELGKVVVHYADRMFAAYDELKSKVSLRAEQQESHFRLGICRYLGTRFSFDLLELVAMSDLLQAKTSSITFDSSEKLLAGFAEDQFNLVTGAFEPEQTKNNSWISHELNFPVRLFAPHGMMEGIEAELRKSLSKDVNLMIEHANARGLALVLPAQPSILRDETDRFLSSLSVRPAKVIECNSSSAIVQLIERGLAIGLVPTPCLLDFKSGESLKVWGPPGGYWSHGISIISLQGKEGSLTKAPTGGEVFLSDSVGVHLT